MVKLDDFRRVRGSCWEKCVERWERSGGGGLVDVDMVEDVVSVTSVEDMAEGLGLASRLGSGTLIRYLPTVR